MSLKFDSKETIKESKRNLCLSKLMRLATSSDNRDFEVILKKAGLSSYINSHSMCLSPYSYNGQWENPNVQYYPESAFDFFFDEIGDDKEHQYSFLKAIVEQIKKIDYSDLEEYNRCLATLGYEIDYGSSSDDCKRYTLKHAMVTIQKDAENISRFEELCESKSSGSYEHYKEAVSNFRNGDYSSAISNCRKTLEAIATSISGESKLANALFKFSNEAFSDATDTVQDVNQAVNYWAKKKDKVYRFMRLTTLYNIQCGFGSHNDVVPDMNDALWVLRETQSTIYWMCNRNS